VRNIVASSTMLLLCFSSWTAKAQQQPSESQVPPAPLAIKKELPVNWLYGAYVPKDAPLVSLTNELRWKLYVRQSFTTPGIYIKTGLFAMRDSLANSPPEWGKTAEGFGKRLGSRYAQFLIQNSFTASGDALAKWEPRYDRCRCNGTKNRVKHAFIRNFVTYASDERSLRPQVFSYAAAFGGASLSSLWEPNHPNAVVKGYQGVVSQAWVGVVSNLLGEFAPDFNRWRKHRHGN
jgi:hypothetical protein